MFDFLIKIRNYLIKIVYKYVLKPIFFKFDPEDVHDHMTSAGIFLGKYTLTKKLTKKMI
jgi:hypothetical protein